MSSRDNVVDAAASPSSSASFSGPPRDGYSDVVGEFSSHYSTP
jgi:hypothetical protein